MAAFEYKALGADGKKTSGIINADNKKQARSQLKRKGLFPTEVKEQQSGKATKGEGLSIEIDFSKFFERVSSQELAEMTSQMETLIRTSIDIAETLEILADQTENNMLRLALVEIQDKVKKGGIPLVGYERASKDFQQTLCFSCRSWSRDWSIRRYLGKTA